MKSSLLGLILLAPALSAGVIRTIEVDSQKMGDVFLKLGQSTVLRFKEKPKKVVVGNQNYFSVEFVDNDLTIQPQEIVTSNLFVYGEYHTYGLILNVGDYRQYDDLVNINWKNRQIRYTLGEPQENKKEPKRPQIALKVIKNFKDMVKGLWVVDLSVSASIPLKESDLDIKLLADGKTLTKEIVFYPNSKNEIINVRLIFKAVKHQVEVVASGKGMKANINLSKEIKSNGQRKN